MYQNLAKVVTQKARVKAIEKFKREFEVEECLLDAAWDKDNDVVIYNETHPNHIINPWKVYSVSHISIHPSKRLCSKMALGEVGVSLP